MKSKTTLAVLILMFAFAPQAFAHAEEDNTAVDADVNAKAEIRFDTIKAEQIRNTIKRSVPNPTLRNDIQIRVDGRADVQVDGDRPERTDAPRDRFEAELRAKATTSAEMRREKASEEKEARMAEREEKRAELDARKKAHFKEVLKRTLARFNAAIGRLNSMAERIESRIQKLADNGVDVGTAVALLADARLDINSAESVMLSIEAQIDSALDSDNPKEALEGIRALFEEAKTAIKSAHRSLVDVITELKQGLLKARENASVEADVEVDGTVETN